MAQARADGGLGHGFEGGAAGKNGRAADTQKAKKKMGGRMAGGGQKNDSKNQV